MLHHLERIEESGRFSEFEAHDSKKPEIASRSEMIGPCFNSFFGVVKHRSVPFGNPNIVNFPIKDAGSFQFTM